MTCAARSSAKQIVSWQLLIDYQHLREQLTDTQYAYLLGYLCMAYTDEHRYDEAIRTGTLAVHIARDRAPHDAALRGHVRLNLGVAHCLNDQIDQGMPLYLDSWHHAGVAGDDETRLKAGRNSLLNLEAGYPLDEQVTEFLLEYLPFVFDRSHYDDVARVHALLGRVELDGDRPAAAVLHLNQALRLAIGPGGHHELRRRGVAWLEEANDLLAARGEAGPELGSGERIEVCLLVRDGVENARRGASRVKDTCFRTALSLLRRRTDDGDRVLAAHLLLHLGGDPTAEIARITLPKAARQARAALSRPSLDELERLARIRSSPPTRRGPRPDRSPSRGRKGNR